MPDGWIALRCDSCSGKLVPYYGDSPPGFLLIRNADKYALEELVQHWKEFTQRWQETSLPVLTNADIEYIKLNHSFEDLLRCSYCDTLYQRDGDPITEK